MHAQNTVGLGIGQHFDNAFGLAQRQRTTVGRKARLAFFIGHALGFELLLGFAHPSNFGVGVDHKRNGVEIDMRFLAGNALGHGHALIAGFVCQHRAAHHITDCPHARQVGAAITIHFDKAALVFFQADGFGVQTGGVRNAADRDNELVEGFGFLFTAHFISYGDAVFIVFDFIELHAQFNRQALFFDEDFQGFFGNLLVGGG